MLPLLYVYRSGEKACIVCRIVARFSFPKGTCVELPQVETLARKMLLSFCIKRGEPYWLRQESSPLC
jgi:hypothetical protein